MVWHSVRTETKEQAFARLTRPKSCHTLLNLNNPTASTSTSSCAPIPYQNPYIRQTGDFKWPYGLSKARSLSELPRNNAKFLKPERSERVTRRDMQNYFRKSMGVEEFGKVLCKLEAFVDAGEGGGGGNGNGEALTIISNNNNVNMTSNSDSPKSNPGPYTTQSISLHSLTSDLSKIQSKLSLITKSQLCGKPTTGQGGVLTSEGQYREKLKVWHPGQDGDFHLPSANPGYGRTPYGGHFTNYR